MKFCLGTLIMVFLGFGNGLSAQERYPIKLWSHPTPKLHEVIERFEFAIQRRKSLAQALELIAAYEEERSYAKGHQVARILWMKDSLNPAVREAYARTAFSCGKWERALDLPLEEMEELRSFQAAVEMARMKPGEYAAEFSVSPLNLNPGYPVVRVVPWASILFFGGKAPSQGLSIGISHPYDVPVIGLQARRVANLQDSGHALESSELPKGGSRFSNFIPIGSRADTLFLFFHRPAIDHGEPPIFKLQKTVWKNGKWSKTKTVDIPISGPSLLHTAFHPVLPKIIFATDELSDSQGMDLYVIEHRNGQWSQPLRLGPEINSSKDEVFPYWSADGRLYFASNGRPGHGGFDIYHSRKKAGVWSEAYNLGSPVNSSQDDIAYVDHGKGNTGYFCSNRSKKNGRYEYGAYSFKRILPDLSNCMVQSLSMGCYGFSHGELALSSYGSYLQWDLGDGTVVNGEAIRHCYKEPGIYEVVLREMDVKTGQVLQEKPLQVEYENESPFFIRPEIKSWNPTETPLRLSAISMHDSIAHKLFWLDGRRIFSEDSQIHTAPEEIHARTLVLARPLPTNPDSSTTVNCICIQKSGGTFHLPEILGDSSEKFQILLGHSSQPFPCDTDAFPLLRGVTRRYLAPNYFYLWGSFQSYSKAAQALENVIHTGYPAAKIVQSHGKDPKLWLSATEIPMGYGAWIQANGRSGYNQIVQFKFGKRKLSSEMQSQLDAIGLLLVDNPTWNLEVGVHVGEGEDEKLAAMRFKAVSKKILKAEGLSPERLLFQPRIDVPHFTHDLNRLQKSIETQVDFRIIFSQTP